MKSYDILENLRGKARYQKALKLPYIKLKLTHKPFNCSHEAFAVV